MNRVLIVGALVLLILIPTLVCFGIISMMTPFASSDRASPEDILEAQGTIHSFLDELRSNNLDAAYGWTSGNFKGRQTKEDFQAWADKYPQLPELSEESMNQKAGASSKAIAYEIVLAAKGKNRIKLNLALIKDDGGWKVDTVSAQ